MTGFRVAVAPGRHAVRVAGVAGADPPRLLATLPTQVEHPVTRLAEVLGTTVEEVVLVYPPGRVAPSVRAWLAAADTVATRTSARVRRVAAPVAAVAGADAQAVLGAVLDVGRTGAEATLVRSGRIVARRSCGAGGDRLDLAVRDLLAQAGVGASTADARRVRETLSLLPEARHGPFQVDAAAAAAVLTPLLDEAVAALADVVAVAAVPVAVLLTGGVARAPLLAERVDAAAISPDVRVAAAPDLAAVLGALALPPAVGPPGAPRPPVPPAARARALLPDPPPVRRVRRLLSAAAVAVLVGGAAAAGTAVAATALPLHPAGGDIAEVPAGVLVQYGYRIEVPAGWEHSGGLPERRRSLLTRITAPDGTDLIAAERTPLGYDARAEPERAAAELRAAFDRSVASGSTLSGYTTTAVAGRPVVTYRQQERAGAVVDWFVVLDGDAQLSVGCRHTAASTAAVRAACAVVTGSIRPA